MTHEHQTEEKKRCVALEREATGGGLGNGAAMRPLQPGNHRERFWSTSRYSKAALLFAERGAGGWKWPRYGELGWRGVSEYL